MTEKELKEFTAEALKDAEKLVADLAAALEKDLANHKKEFDSVTGDIKRTAEEKKCCFDSESIEKELEELKAAAKEAGERIEAAAKDVKEAAKRSQPEREKFMDGLVETTKELRRSLERLAKLNENDIKAAASAFEEDIKALKPELERHLEEVKKTVKEFMEEMNK